MLGPVSFTSHQRKINLATNHGSEPEVNTFPASEQRISEVERGQISNAILPMPVGKTLCAGDSIIFALVSSHGGQENRFVQDGDSVCVSLTQVTDLGAIDPATGQALFRLSWKQLGQCGSTAKTAKRVMRPRVAHGTALPSTLLDPTAEPQRPSDLDPLSVILMNG
jgi:hypothetical protein